MASFLPGDEVRTNSAFSPVFSRMSELGANTVSVPGSFSFSKFWRPPLFLMEVHISFFVPFIKHLAMGPRPHSRI